MRFRPTRFDRHLNNMGQQALWRKAYTCPCVTSSGTGQPDPRHALCKGKGHIWEAPIATVVGVPSQSTNQKWMAAGQWDAGDMTLSIPHSSPMWNGAGKFDRVVMQNSTDPFSVKLQHGDPSEQLLFPVASIDRVFWLDGSGNIVDGGIPTVGPDGRLTWADDEPPQGAYYSISGTKFSEYFILDHYPSDRNQHSGVPLPKKVQLRRWDLFGR